VTSNGAQNGDMVVDAIVGEASIAVDGSQTGGEDENVDDTGWSMGISYESATGSTVMSWTSGACCCATGAIALIPASAGGGGPPTGSLMLMGVGK
jgi:hypothetical protein